MVVEGFQSVAFPAASERAKFLMKDEQIERIHNRNDTYQPYTATGKLKAEMTATTPNGLGTVAGTVRNRRCETRRTYRTLEHCS